MATPAKRKGQRAVSPGLKAATSKKQRLAEEKRDEAFITSVLASGEEDIMQMKNDIIRMLDENPAWVTHVNSMMKKGVFHKLVKRMVEEGGATDVDPLVDLGPLVKLSKGKGNTRRLDFLKPCTKWMMLRHVIKGIMTESKDHSLSKIDTLYGRVFMVKDTFLPDHPDCLRQKILLDLHEQRFREMNEPFKDLEIVDETFDFDDVTPIWEVKNGNELVFLPMNLKRALAYKNTNGNNFTFELSDVNDFDCTVTAKEDKMLQFQASVFFSELDGCDLTKAWPYDVDPNKFNSTDAASSSAASSKAATTATSPTPVIVPKPTLRQS